MKRPAENEYAQYYQKYIDKVGDDVFAVLQQQCEEILQTLASVDEEKANYSYAEGKWTVKELFGHMIDTERVFSYRAMSIARGETQPLPGMDQDLFVKGANFNKRTLSSLEDEYKHLRMANIALFNSFSESDLERKGTASGYPVTVRGLIFITAGHEKHHLNILKERYNL